MPIHKMGYRGKSGADNGSGVDRFVLLEEKGRQLHVALMWIVAIYSVLFFFVNTALGQPEQAMVTIAALPAVCITWLLYNSGYYYYSKVWNSVQISVLLSLIVLYSGPKMFGHAFFVPVILGILITFQGKERITGYIISGFVLLIMLLLQTFEWQLGEAKNEEGSSSMMVERTINLVGATVIIIIQAIFLIRTNDEIQGKILEQSENINRRNDQLKTAIYEARKMNQQLVTYNQELEKLNRDLDQFVYSASHDLRAPVLAISGIVDEILDPETDEETKKQDLFRIQKVVGRLDDTISDIVSYSKNTRLPVLPERVDLESMVKELFDSMRYLKRFDIGLFVDLEISCDLWSDRSRIQSLLKNLLSNAIKFSVDRPEGSRIRVTGKVDTQSCYVEIADNGEGIPEAYQASVFDMFYRATSSSHGTGLGLYICNEIMKKLGGAVTLKSELGKGTTICLTIPNNKSNG
ncbi:MAG: hypothetical protein RL090_1825 [Bacteroidota bacterium]|jgi:signal transduction histidine kinase